MHARNKLSSVGEQSTKRISQVRELIDPAVLLRWCSGSKGDPRRWKHLQLADMTEGYFAKFNSDCNIGVALGKASRGLVSIDFDEDACADHFLTVNPRLQKTLRTRASRGCNIWIRCSGSYPGSCKLRDLSGKEIGEWRGDGCQTVISGIHPAGVPYRFVIEQPAITVQYDEIIWPTASLVAPDATEKKRRRGSKGKGEEEVVDVARAMTVVPALAAGNECQIQARLGKDLISEVAPIDYHQNNDSLFNLGRLVRRYENAAGRSATHAELQFVFDRWSEVSSQFWRPEQTRDDYFAEFLMCYTYARIGLDENPIELAVSRAKTGPLPDLPGFSSERIRLLVATCRELQNITGADPFYLPTRKLAKVFEVHWTCAANWLRALELSGIIYLASGEVRMRGGKRCPRYHYDEAWNPRIALDLKLTGGSET